MNPPPRSPSSFFRIALVLGLLSAIGPFAIDMYLPALPEIGSSLGAGIGQVQLTLTVFFIALGVGQLLYGPVSDMLGRRLPLFFGIGLFAAASIGCALTTDVDLLIALRFVQGLGAAAGMAIPRAIVRDLHTGAEAARLMSLLMLVFSVSPILAPLVGSGLIAAWGWRSVFWAVTLAAAIGLATVAGVLRETRPAAERLESSIGSALSGYLLLLRDRHFLGLVFIGAFAMAGFFTYLANSSFVLIGHYGLSPSLYSVAFGINAASFFGAAQLNGMLCRRFGIVPVVRFGVGACTVAMLVMFFYYFAGGDRLAVLLVVYFFATACIGLVIPTTSVLALEEHGAIAGTASALMGTLQMLTGSLAMSFVGLFTDGRPLPMVAGMAGGVLVSAVLTWATLGGRRGAVYGAG